MAIFEWNDSYSVGNAVVDDQHRKLVEMINDLDQAFSVGQETAAINNLYGKLANYAQLHFKTEEEMMLAGHCDESHFRRHKGEHHDFVQMVSNMHEALDTADTQVADAILDYLIKWLMHHIMGEDKDMIRLLDGRLGGQGEARVAFLERALDQEIAERNLLSALRESESRFRMLADQVPVLIWMEEPGRGRTFFNQTWLDYTGKALKDVMGELWKTDVHSEDLDHVAATVAGAWQSRERYTAEYRLRMKNGSYHWLLETGVPRFLNDGELSGYVGASVDITERKKAEFLMKIAHNQLEQRVEERTAELNQANLRLSREKAEQLALIRKLEEAQNQLLQSEKMAAIGQLAAGVAHEINNPIGYVQSNLGSLKGYAANLLTLIDAYEHAEHAIDAASLQKIRAVKDSIEIDFLRTDLSSLLAESQEGITRVKKIVQDLKDFSHVDESEWQWADINHSLDTTLNVVWNELKYKAEVVKDYGKLPEVHCLPHQLSQVFMNILVNAAHAIEEHGTITIRTYAENGKVVIEISDTGTGIAPEALRRIFEPFFTTKPVGKGTGLGLSLARSIIEKHEGSIDVESEPGKGSTFRITLRVDIEA